MKGWFYLDNENYFKFIKYEDMYLAVRDDDEIGGACFKKILEHMKEVPSIIVSASELEKLYKRNTVRELSNE